MAAWCVHRITGSQEGSGSARLRVRTENKGKIKGVGQSLKELFCPHLRLGTSSSRQKRVTGGLKPGSAVSRVCSRGQRRYKFGVVTL